ncbi:MAG TPA: permease [Salinivirga sp.]|uniref:permease n=1 Tax=Salinivirga sp. TaxID=1970192 RepID=UPI002B48C6C6|nr:permease [Salinivirga sp.]HKK60412.1 permease [Salinivirga sp.]
MLNYINTFFSELWHLTLEMAPYLMLGFLFAGVLHVWFPQHKVNRFMGKHNLRSVFNASLIGVPLPLCSCGVIPAGVSFYKNGASKGSAISFMTSTPQTGVDSILVTWSMLGLPLALIRPVVAMITGIFSGWWVNKGEKQKIISKPLNEGSSQHIKDNKIVAMLRYAFIDFMADIVKWLALGLLLAALIAVIVPDDFFSQHMTHPAYEYLFVILASIPLYVCATASVPIAAVLILKGISPGAALVFLMAGPATNAATITVIAQTLGRISFIKYLVTIIVGAIASGLVIDYLLPSSWFAIEQSMQTHEHGILPEWLIYSSATILILLILYHLMKILGNLFSKERFKTREVVSGEKLDNPNLHVSGMDCKHCKMNIEKHLKQIDGVDHVEANENTGYVAVQGKNVPIDSVQQQVKDLGYKLEGVIV